MKLTSRTRWLLASPLLLLLLAVLGYVAAGPFLAIHSIRDLVARGQTQEPVSYTHLDVYKRQVIQSAIDPTEVIANHHALQGFVHRIATAQVEKIRRRPYLGGRRLADALHHLRFNDGRWIEHDRLLVR